MALRLERTRRYSCIGVARYARGAHPSERRCVALLRVDGSVFVEYEDGTKEWCSRTEARGGALYAVADGGAAASDTGEARARDAVRAASALRSVRASGATVLERHGEDCCVVRGALDSVALDEVRSLAAAAASAPGTTVRRRSVGAMDGIAAPGMAHARLTRRFLGGAPSCYAALVAAAATVDAGGGLAFKQADYLAYGPGDSAGWHDHAGESACFVVACVGASPDLRGGAFLARPPGVPGGLATTLRVGDVVACRSRVDHAVEAVEAGARATLNVDFWRVSGPDRRSRHDLD